MKCPHCSNDIPQRLVLSDAAKILAKNRPSDFTVTIDVLIKHFQALDIKNEYAAILDDLQMIRLFLLKGAK
jgi:hypothetical protein